MSSEPRFRFFGSDVSEDTLAKLPDRLVLQETCPGGVLVRIERHIRPPVPMPRKAVEL